MTDQPKDLALTNDFRETVKYKTWCRYFLDPRNKETYGNATRSALRVYNTESENAAAVIGHENLRKLKSKAALIAEKEGFGFADLMRIGLKKVMDGKYDDWEKMMYRLGYFQEGEGDQTPKQQTVVNVQNVISSWVQKDGTQ